MTNTYNTPAEQGERAAKAQARIPYPQRIRAEREEARQRNHEKMMTRFTANTEEIKTKLAQIAAFVSEKGEQSHKNWADVGDLAHINEQLGYLVSFINNDPEA